MKVISPMGRQRFFVLPIDRDQKFLLGEASLFVVRGHQTTFDNQLENQLLQYRD